MDPQTQNSGAASPDAGDLFAPPKAEPSSGMATPDAGDLFAEPQATPAPVAKPAVPQGPNAGLAPPAGGPSSQKMSANGAIAANELSFGLALADLPKTIWHQSFFGELGNPKVKAEHEARDAAIKNATEQPGMGPGAAATAKLINPVVKTDEGTPAEHIDWGATAANVAPLLLEGARKSGALGERFSEAKGAVENARDFVKGNPARTAAAIKATVPEAAHLPDNAVVAGDKVVRAVSPTGMDQRARTNIHVASGDLAEISKGVDWDKTRGVGTSPDMRPRAVLNATRAYEQQMYDTERAPQINNKPNAPVQANLAGNTGGGLQYLADAAGDEATQGLAKKVIQQGGKMTLQEADHLATTVNIELSKVQSLPADQRVALQVSQPKVNGLYALDKELSNVIDRELDAQGQPGVKSYERRYAALKNFEHDLAKRVNEAERDRPASTAEALIKPAQKAYKVVTGGAKGIASASAAAASNVGIGDMLEKGMRGLEKSGIGPIKDLPRSPAGRPTGVEPFNPAVNSPSRTMPGQHTPEISSRTAHERPVTKLPSLNRGLQLKGRVKK